MPDFTLPVHYVRLIAELVAGMGIDVPHWLAQAGLTEADLADSTRGLSYQAFHRLMSEGLRISDEPALGLLVGERLRINTHGMLGYAAMNSGTLRQAMDLFERFIGVRTTLVSVRHIIQGDELELIFEPTQPLGDIETAVMEAIVLTVKNLLDHLTMGHCQVTRVCFSIPEPEHAALARDMFKCEVHYGQSWTGFALPVHVLDEPLSTADPASFEEAARICQRELDKRAEQTSMSARVRRILLERQNGFPSLQVTARLFHLTPRTLHRRLEEENSSYHDLLEEVRHMLAVQHLKGRQLSIQEIAYSLGYNDQANFRRAFKRWEGVAPSEYRAALPSGAAANT
jgi:AraC-like DNA-binding protein